MLVMNWWVLARPRAAWLVAAGMLAAPGLAVAQSGADPLPPQEGGLIVEKMENGFVLTPDFRVTQVDDETGYLAGIRAGWLTDDRLLIGGAGYWLAGDSAGREMGYGGLVVEWSLARSERVGLSLGALVGGGSSTLPVEVTGYPPGRRPWRRSGAGPGEPRTFLVPASEGFFILEPQASASFLLARWLRLGAGVSYRLLAGAGDFESRLRGVSGSVSVQIGTF